MTDRPFVLLTVGNFSIADQEALADAVIYGVLDLDGLNAAISLHHHDGVPVSECIAANRNNCGATEPEIRAAVWEVMGGNLPAKFADDQKQMTLWATGQAMVKLRGAANPKVVADLVNLRLHIATVCAHPPSSPTEG